WLRPRTDRARGRGCLYLRRGNRAARLVGGPPGPASPATAIPRGCRPLRLPHRGQQRGIHRQRSAGLAQRGGLVPLDGLGEITGLHAVLALGPRRHPRAIRSAARHHAPRAARIRRRYPRRTLPEVLDTGRLVDTATDGGTPRRAIGLRGYGRR